MHPLDQRTIDTGYVTEIIKEQVKQSVTKYAKQSAVVYLW